jgi:hypothetical protein
VNLAYAGRVRDEPRLLGRLLGYDKLTPLHDRWIRECWDTMGSHALMAYRGSYKTTAVVTVGIIRYFLFFPDSRILVIRKTFTEAAKIVKAVSAAFDSPILNALFHESHGIAPRKTAGGCLSISSPPSPPRRALPPTASPPPSPASTRT